MVARAMPPLPRLNGTDPATLLAWSNQLVAAIERQITAMNAVGDVEGTSLTLSGPVYLDRAATVWVKEDSTGRVVIGRGDTRLFSIDTNGNAVALGTVTNSGTP
jgi:hypothetical protein